MQMIKPKKGINSNKAYLEIRYKYIKGNNNKKIKNNKYKLYTWRHLQIGIILLQLFNKQVYNSLFSLPTL